MQALMTRAWAEEAPLVKATAGDLHWWMYQHTDKLDEVRIALWEESDQLVGWTWLWLPQTLFAHVLPEHRAGAGFEAMLDWFEAEAAAAATPPEELDVDAMADHAEQRALLERRGYRLVPDEYMEHLVGELDTLPEPDPPPGFELRPVSLPDDLADRVQAHRAAFAPSRVTEASYGALVSRPPYRADLDWVAVAPDGRFAAFCLVWLDEQNRVAEMEPVGTHPDFRRLGLARAVCLAALRAARERGAETGLVYAVGGSAAVGLYAGLGLRPVTRHLTYRREVERREER
jgi:ribosomal protein S18 acetylase RimI-like enzyme